MFDVLNKGGGFMYVLLAVSVASLALVAERVWVLWFKWKVDGRTLYGQVRKHIEQENSYSKALELASSHPDHPVASVLQAGLVKANQPDREIQRGLEEAAVRALPPVQARSGYISMIANVATLLGLLGTIFGLIQAFKSVGAASAAMKQELLAKGISVAMLTTAFGLIIAVPTMIAFSIIAARQTRIMDAIEESSLGLFNFLSNRNRRIRELGPEAFEALQAEALAEAASGGNGDGGGAETEAEDEGDGAADA
jgi:biopolymer transport protein ExbB